MPAFIARVRKANTVYALVVRVDNAPLTPSHVSAMSTHRGRMHSSSLSWE